MSIIIKEPHSKLYCSSVILFEKLNLQGLDYQNEQS